MFQKEQGFTQWTEEYPNLQSVCDDIRAGKGYVLMADDEIAGYMCIDLDGEPAYERIEGAWHSDEPYAVVHRMAFSRKYIGCGLSSVAWPLIEKLCLHKGVKYVRVDTDPQNKSMQHVLTKNGFTECGVIYFQGSGKVAFDKTIT